MNTYLFLLHFVQEFFSDFSHEIIQISVSDRNKTLSDLSADYTPSKMI